jgi:hypothetical protein
MNKETANLKFKEIEQKIVQTEKLRTQEIQLLEKEKYQPIIEQAKEMKDKIHSDTYEKYKQELSVMYKELKDVKEVVNKYKIQDANNIWYPQGTLVFLWKRKNSHSWFNNNPIEKTEQSGVVTIYDGTQKIASVSSYRMPKIGDVIVLLNKKDGTVGLKFEVISTYGSMNNYTKSWYCEGESPTDNIKLRKQAVEDAECSNNA